MWNLIIVRHFHNFLRNLKFYDKIQKYKVKSEKDERILNNKANSKIKPRFCLIISGIVWIIQTLSYYSKSLRKLITRRASLTI